MDPSGSPLKLKTVNKLFRDILVFVNGQEDTGRELITTVDPLEPLAATLRPGKDSPLCLKCGLDQLGATHPYFGPTGADNPLITIITDSVTGKEDGRGALASDGVSGFLSKFIDDTSRETGVTSRDIRWVPLTRCAVKISKKPDFKGKGRWCKHHLVQDLRDHRPKLIMPVGTAALGSLCYKSNAQDWGGKMLTYRGWPDDWLTDPNYVLPQVDIADETKTRVGHPLYGAPPSWKVPLFPIQNPRIVYGTQNPQIILRWKKDFKIGLIAAREGVSPKEYCKPWYRITTDVEEIISKLSWLIDHPGTILTYDTETNGLRPWQPEMRIVFMMFRWDDDNGAPQAIGFPWEFYQSEAWPNGSPMLPYLERLAPVIIKALSVSRINGHNIGFDALFSIANIPEGEKNLDKIAEAVWSDTWHMSYTMQQRRGTLSLDAVAYDWCPDIAGYEEEMELLIELHRDTMHPDSGPHAHYANCPQDKWEALKVYVMGDVEVAHQARKAIRDKLESLPQYKIPLAHPEYRGKFRWFKPMSRLHVYEHIISPANRLLIKMMARGMAVDVNELASQEDLLPKQLMELREKLKNIDPRIVNWAAQMESTEDGWVFDLESPPVLKSLLFQVLDLPVFKLTEKGQEIYGDAVDSTIPRDKQIEYAKVDKFTLNKLAAVFPNVRPLLDYRKLFKAYSSYIRPIRNAFFEGFDKKQRDKPQHLARDGRVHAQFLLTGTRSGRLCVDGSTALRVMLDGHEALVAIKDIDLSRYNQVLVKSHTGSWNRVTHKYFKGYEKMFKVKTSGGRHVICTGRHRLLTRSGWRHLEDIKIGDSLQIDPDWDEVRDVLCDSRGRFSSICSSQSEHDNASACGFFRKVAVGNVGLVQTKISPGTCCIASSGTFCSESWKSEWRAPAVNRHSSGRFKGRFGSRTFNRGHSREIQHNVVYSQSECSITRASVFGYSFGQVEKCKFGYVKAYRTPVSWFSGGFSKLCERPKAFCTNVESGVYETERGHMVSSGYRFGRSDLETRTERSLRCVLEHESMGGVSCIRTRGPQDCVCSRDASKAMGLCEFSSGLCDLEFEFDCGNRWRVSPRKRRSFKGQEIGRPRVSRGAFSKRNGVSGRNIQDQGLSEDAIISIEDVGCRPVWDIQVSIDHSYCAGGLIHHNSGRDPNLQQLSSSTTIKRIYTSRFGDVGRLYGVDLSQIELRLIAAACGDESMVRAYREDIDLHSMSQSKIFNRPYEQCTKEYMIELQQAGHNDEAKKLDMERKISKTINFLTGYGGGAHGLQATLANSGIYFEIEKCEGFLDAFFESYPALREYLGYYKGFIAENGVAVSISGRVRVFEEVFSDNKQFANKALRAGCNHLIQATASDMMLICMGTIEGIMRAEGMQSMLISTVHDSALIDGPKDEIPTCHDISMSVLCNMPEVMKAWFGPDFDTSWMIVPFKGDAEVGKNYLESKKLSMSNNDWDEVLG